MMGRFRIRHPVRLTLVGLLSATTSLAFTGLVPAPPGTATGFVLLLAVVLTDLLHEYSPDTADQHTEPQPTARTEPDLDTDSLLMDAWREDK